MQIFSWLCCGNYALAAVIWGCLAVLTTTAFFLHDRFKPQDDMVAREILALEHYRSDVETKLLCVSLKVGI
jgi:hypothetical protein